MTIAAADIAHWQQWVGRTETRAERLDVEALRRFAAAVGADLAVERTLPPLAHWAFFLPVVDAAAVGVDGHPARGGFLPPISLPRRMFAAASMRFGAALALDALAERRSRVVSVVHKAGRSGDLVLVEVEHAIVQAGDPRVVEQQTIVYRDAGAPTPPVTPASAAPPSARRWQPGPVDLFRFSAVTFNGHRIHYDLPYAMGEEGYPGLVVHGPLTATQLFALAAAGGRRPTRFSFRAVAPLFAGQPIALVADADTPGSVAAIRCDGVTAMTAQASFGDD